jgi:hypothetical protein
MIKYIIILIPIQKIHINIIIKVIEFQPEYNKKFEIIIHIWCSVRVTSSE